MITQPFRPAPQSAKTPAAHGTCAAGDWDLELLSSLPLQRFQARSESRLRLMVRIFTGHGLLSESAVVVSNREIPDTIRSLCDPGLRRPAY